MAALHRVLIAAALLAVGTETTSAEALPEDLSGYYRVEGVVTENATGIQRNVSGSLLISPGEAMAYVIRFNLKTQMKTPEGEVKADLIGTGEARREDERLVGSAQTQAIWAAIPGIDPRFAFIPGKLGPRIVSTFEMQAEPEPEVFVSKVETQAAPGFEYTRTTTSMRLVRISQEQPQDDRLPIPEPRED